MWLKEEKKTHTKFIVKYFFTARSNFMKKKIKIMTKKKEKKKLHNTAYENIK